MDDLVNGSDVETTISRGARSILIGLLPRGSTLHPDALLRRHRAILLLLWAHVPLLFGVALYTGNSVYHSALEASIVAVLAVGASFSDNWKVSAALATLGLISSSAILVHLSGGLIEMHFHFFVMVAVVTLYQSWLPFLLAIGFVLIHHGAVGALDPAAVYNHPEAIDAPWKWAVVHALFLSGAAAAGLTAWKLNELVLDRERTVRVNLEEANADLAHAQQIAHVGNWDRDVSGSKVFWSEEFYRILGLDPETTVASYDAFIEMLVPEDRQLVLAIGQTAKETGNNFTYEARVKRPDGSIRWIHSIGAPVKGSNGKVRSITGTVQDITERKALEEKIEHQAFHDSLTGLANRSLFLDRVDHAMQRQQRQRFPLAVLFLDLDDFKTINDSKGHGAGDELLIAVAGKVDDLLRSADTFARFGGDEFAILLEDITLQEAMEVADRLVALFDTPFMIDGTDVFVDVSIGIAFETGLDANTPDELVRNADTAMYEAKRSGKGSYQLFEVGMQIAARNRLELRSELQRAIDNNEFVLHYQPIVDLVSGHIRGAEALIRWQHPERGFVPPMEFIPFAEETGLILPIGRWVLEEACRTAARWAVPKSGAAPTIAVNLSATRLKRADVIDEIKEVLAITGLAPERLTLELTETTLADADLALERLSALKELGIRLAIDDFGTGFSSLSYLRDFPIDILKIDKTFIDSIAKGPEESALPRAITKLGQTLGLQVVAEGIEHEDQREELRVLGCPSGQGYYFWKPMSQDAIDELIGTSLTAGQLSNAPVSS